MVGFRDDSIHAFEQSLGDAAGPGEPTRGYNRQDLVGENPLSKLGTLVAFAFKGTDFGIALKIRMQMMSVSMPRYSKISINTRASVSILDVSDEAFRVQFSAKACMRQSLLNVVCLYYRQKSYRQVWRVAGWAALKGSRIIRRDNNRGPF